MLKKFILCFAAGLTALSLGLGVFYAGEFLVSIFQTSETVEAKAIETVEPEKIPVEELIYPKISAQTEDTKQKSEDKVHEFDPTGEYYLIGGGEKQFQDFDGFYIKSMNFEEDFSANLWIQESNLPEGYLFNEAGKKLKFNRFFVTEQQIYFETVSKNGISYRFEGKFIEAKEVEYKDGKEWAHIEGYLIKLRNGNEIVQRIAHYTIYPGC
jgi:hypothetical protein